MIGGDDIHVWAFDLDVDPSRLAELERLLAKDELARAAGFRLPADRVRFVAARGMLRQVLGRCAGREPELLQFVYSDLGKPSLSASSRQDCLKFNLAGSDTIALLALRLDADVGIDVERLRPLPETPTLTSRLLTAEEHVELSSLPEAEREMRFYEYWVRKEALSKSLGSGLRLPFDSFSLYPWPGDMACRVECRLDGRVVAQWVVPLKLPRSGYAAALASPAPFGSVHRWSWDPPRT